MQRHKNFCLLSRRYIVTLFSYMTSLHIVLRHHPGPNAKGKSSCILRYASATAPPKSCQNNPQCNTYQNDEMSCLQAQFEQVSCMRCQLVSSFSMPTCVSLPTSLLELWPMCFFGIRPQQIFGFFGLSSDQFLVLVPHTYIYVHLRRLFLLIDISGTQPTRIVGDLFLADVLCSMCEFTDDAFQKPLLRKPSLRSQRNFCVPSSLLNLPDDKTPRTPGE